MSPPAIKIRIGCSVDSSVDKSFATVEARAKKAYANAAKAAQKASEQSAKAAQGTATGWGKAATEAERATGKLRDAQVGAWAQIGKVAERELNRQSQSVYRETEKQRKYVEDANRRMGESFARRTSYTAARFLAPHAPLASIAKRAAGDLLRGAGVDLSLGGSVGRSVDLESRATALSNQAYQAGAAGPNGVRQRPGDLAGEARKVAGELAFNPADVLSGLEKFTTKTGDLKTGREILKEMAALAGATGTNLEDAVDASADVANALGDVPNKSARVVEIMKTIAGQGKLGAVEMKDLATQMAKVSSAATQIEGDRGENIKKLGALVQFARATGGASSASQAATSLPRFVDALTSEKTIKKFRAAGIETTNAQGVARDPFAVILETLAKTKGDPTKINHLLTGSIGNKPLKALAATFRDAGGGEKGIEAVGAELKKYLKDAAIGDKEIKDSNAARMETTAAKVQKFQNALDVAGDQFRVSMIPAFDALAPKVLAAAEIFGKVATWAAENPKQAIAAGIGLSVARAGIEQTLRAGIERTLLGVGDKGASKLGGAVGGIGSAFTLASVAVASFSVTSMVVETLFAKAQQEQKKKVEDDIEAFNNLQAAKRLGVKADPEALKQFIATREGQVKEGDSVHVVDKLLDALVWIGAGGAGAGKEPIEAMDARKAAEKMVLEQQRKELVESKALLAKILTAVSKQGAPAIPRVGQ